MKKNVLAFSYFIVLVQIVVGQAQSQDLNMGTYQLQFLSASGGSNRIQGFGGSSPGTWLFKSRFDNIVFEAGENNGNKRQIIFKIGDSERLRVNTYGHLGIGTSSPTTKLDIAASGGGSGTSSSLRLRSGNNSSYNGNSQILMSYNAGALYSHSIKSRHHSGQLDGNAIDFYVWQTSDQAGAVGTKHVMSLNAGKVGIGTLHPNATLEVQGAYSGGSGDYTNVLNGQLKLVATSGFIRVPHVSNNSGISTVYN
ncbi:MAG: hypothetical protein AAF193_08090, partial [Bacteroidota bacterium]